MQFDVGPELAERYGLDVEGCAGAQFGERPWHRARYVVGAPGPQQPVEIATVRIRGWHNLGNMVQQLLHALTFAERHGIGLVSGPATPWFRAGTVAGVRLSFGSPFDRPALVGHYFYPQPLGLAEPWRQAHHLRGLRDLFAVDPDPTVSPDAMVVHLRSGDVFGEDPHPDYRPPHLDYYTSVLTHADVGAVRLVSQDWVHPLLRPLQAWCDERGIRTEVQVSDDLRTDLATLVAGTTLCISQGTLGLSAGWLSQSVRAIYLPPGAHVTELRALGVRVFEAELPDSGEPWRASPDQLAALGVGTGPVPLRELP
jgi:hypothetical protein